MKKVFQTITGSEGNCIQAGLASLTGIPLEECFHAFDHPDDDMWGIKLVNWLDSKGYSYSATLYNAINKEDVCTLENIKIMEGINGFFLAGVYSPSERLNDDGSLSEHAVIINKNFEIVHDPNHAYKDIKVYPQAEKLGFNGIVDIWIINKKEN